MNTHVEMLLDQDEAAEFRQDIVFSSPAQGVQAINSLSPSVNIYSTTAVNRTYLDFADLSERLLSPYVDGPAMRIIRTDHVTSQDMVIGLGHQASVLVVESFLGDAALRNTRGTRINPWVTLGPGVEAHAQDVGADAHLETVAGLCLELIPEARHVSVTLETDPEDQTQSFHFAVHTPAQVEAVVAAEEQLHEALFERLPATEARALFSIGYEFAR